MADATDASEENLMLDVMTEVTKGIEVMLQIKQMMLNEMSPNNFNGKEWPESELLLLKTRISSFIAEITVTFAAIVMNRFDGDENCQNEIFSSGLPKTSQNILPQIIDVTQHPHSILQPKESSGSIDPKRLIESARLLLDLKSTLLHLPSSNTSEPTSSDLINLDQCRSLTLQLVKSSQPLKSPQPMEDSIGCADAQPMESSGSMISAQPMELMLRRFERNEDCQNENLSTGSPQRSRNVQLPASDPQTNKSQKTLSTRNSSPLPQLLTITLPQTSEPKSPEIIDLDLYPSPPPIESQQPMESDINPNMPAKNTRVIKLCSQDASKKLSHSVQAIKTTEPNMSINTSLDKCSPAKSQPTSHISQTTLCAQNTFPSTSSQSSSRPDSPELTSSQEQIMFICTCPPRTSRGRGRGRGRGRRLKVEPQKPKRHSLSCRYSKAFLKCFYEIY